MKKMEISQSSIVFALPLIVILNSTIMTADRLSGKFFGSTFPALSGFYANDFLGWGVVLFSTLGILVGNIKIKFIKEKPWEYILVFVVVILLGFVLHNFSLSLRIPSLDDYEILSRLLGTWSYAFLLSGMYIPLIKFVEIFRSANPKST